MPREIIVDWSVEDGGGGLSVTYWDSAAGVAGQRAALSSFLTDLNGILSEETSWSIRQEGRVLNDASGTLTGVWSEGTSYTGTGTVGPFSVLNTSQLLVRWLTDDIVGGRFVRGRTNIPGVDASMTDGNWTTGALTVATTAVTDFLAIPGVSLGVWHRPAVGGTGGSFHEVTGGNVWNESAVLRRRRS